LNIVYAKRLVQIQEAISDLVAYQYYRCN